MRSFELFYPVVGTVKLVRKDNSGDALLVADTYFDPLMEAALKPLWINGTPTRPTPRLLTMWQERRDAFDAEGGVYEFDPADGLAPLLEEASPFLPDLPTDKLQASDQKSPANLEEVRQALIAFLEGGARAGSAITVEDLP